MSKRVSDDEQRKKLEDAYNDMWINEMPVDKWVEKHARYTSEINPHYMNIAYTNIRCKSVSDEVRKKLGKKGFIRGGRRNHMQIILED